MILPYFTRFYNTKLAQNNALYQLSDLSKPGSGGSFLKVRTSAPKSRQFACSFFALNSGFFAIRFCLSGLVAYTIAHGLSQLTAVYCTNCRRFATRILLMQYFFKIFNRHFFCKPDAINRLIENKSVFCHLAAFHLIHNKFTVTFANYLCSFKVA